MSDTDKIVSAFFASPQSYRSEEVEDNDDDICEEFLKIIGDYNESLKNIKLPETVTHVYNPTIYARDTFEMYIRKYCNTKKKIMFFGMNPGPWGMSQTGVPFGEISSVRDWLGIEGCVGKPLEENAARPVRGFDCTRTEVSGKRFWGLFKKLCGFPEVFFETSLVYNYINQQWMNSKGCNITPADFKMSQMESLYNIGDLVFANVLRLYGVETVVAIGRFCLVRAQKAISQYILLKNVKVIYLPHPSPRVVNNNDWEERAISCLRNNNLLQYYCNEDLPVLQHKT
ncbi:single-strand selective monofunctional uracil DNA glycosylase [Pieris napi]|uniref:single-strand selective monofunctional uracil DNA glycosylase n=1 Tax=Pieris napi TaxID=78633 RepID=UPI001FB8D5F8|nr:single-strand selective monofunctional uracil DNA glycosylase [Pieris napi]